MQVISVIPVTLCKYEWEGKEYEFYVFGLDRRTFAPNYPGKNCCIIL
jgi:hypothetical protein